MDQAPSPISKEDFVKKSKSFIFISDKNKKFSFYFQTHLNSEISISANEDNLKKKYYKDFSLIFLKKNKYFSSLDTIDEIFDEIINKISLKKPLINEETNSLKVVIETFHSKFKEITFYLDEKEKTTNEKIEELYSIIYQLKEKEKMQDEKIKKLEEKINVLEKDNIELKERNKVFENDVNDINDINKKSLILKDKNDFIKCLKNWINPNTNLNFKLLYRMSRDGDSIKTFHRLCDNKGPTVSLYLFYDGNIVGGYTPLNWDSNSLWKKDEETFVFNLNKKLKCVKKGINSNSIFCHISYSGFYDTLGYYEASKDSMKKIFFFNSDYYFKNGNKILDYNQKVELELKEVEIFSVNSFW